MICKRFLLSVFALILLSEGGTSSALAQDSGSPDSGVLAPMSGWLVGPAVMTLPAGIPEMPLPCVMMNQFDNGFVLRLSGGGHRLAAMAIDFRQPVFTPGQRYPLRVFILPDYQGDFEATAHDQATLILNLVQDELIYRALAPANGMDMSIGPTVVRFDLTGISDGLRRLESCFRPSKESLPVREVRSLRATPAGEPPSPPEPPPLRPDEQFRPGMKTLSAPQTDPLGLFESRDWLAAQDSGARFSPDRLNGFSRAENTRPLPSETAPLGQNTSLPVWHASAGEDVQDVLARWSRKAGVSLVWTAQRGGRVGSDFRYQGTFEDAVSDFLAQAGTFRGEIRSDALRSGLPEFSNATHSVKSSVVSSQ